MLRLYIGLCLFLTRPQDLPVSLRFAWLSVAAAFGSYLMGNIWLQHRHWLLASVVQVLLLGALLWLLLYLFRLRNRWLQAASAIYASSALLHLVALLALPAAPVDPGAVAMSTAEWVVTLGVKLWFFAVMTYLMREILDLKLTLAIVITLVLEMAFALVLFGLFGFPTAESA